MTYLEAEVLGDRDWLCRSLFISVGLSYRDFSQFGPLSPLTDIIL